MHKTTDQGISNTLMLWSKQMFTMNKMICSPKDTSPADHEYCHTKGDKLRQHAQRLKKH